MGTIPAPNIVQDAASIAAAPQNALAEFARVAQLKQQTAEEQQATQAAQLENQQRQQAIKDQAATTKAFLGWDHKDPNDLATAVVQNGGSASAAQAIQQHYLGLRKTASDIAKQDAETGSTVLNTKIAQHNQSLGKLAALDDVPDEQLSAHLTQTAQEMAQSDDPDDKASAPHIQQLAQLPPTEARQQLKIIEHAAMGEKEQFEQAQEAQKTKATAQEAQAKAQSAQTSAAEFQAKLPGGPLANVEQAEMADYLRKNPGKGPSDFLAWKAKQTPNAVILGNQLGQGGAGSALDQAAQRYSQTGELPAGFSRSPGTTSAIIKRAAEMNPNADIAANKATFNADKSALQKVQTQFDLVNAFEGTALKNLDLYAQTAAKIPDLGSRFANVPLRMITGKMIGTDNMAALNAARNTAASEVAKVLSSATGSGVLSDTQKKEAQDVIDGNLPLSATLAVVNTLKTDMANRHQSYQDDVNAIRGRLGAQPQNPQNTTPSGPTDFFSQFGGKKRTQ